ncbi:MAG: GAF domain-containing sensor histidine kinase [Chloroflexota bacterium]
MPQGKTSEGDQLKAMRQMVRKLARLVEVSVTINSTLDAEALLDFIIRTAADLLECEAASILLYDERAGELRFAAATGSNPEVMAQISVPLEGSIAGNVFSNNRPLVVNDVSTDPRHFGRIGEELRIEPRTLIGVPMRIRERVTGVIEGLNKHSGEFTEDDVQVLSVIASQAAVAIHNAHLLAELRKAYNDLNQLDKRKRDFLAIASHELRTPLGVIMGYATFLQEEAEGEISEHAARVLNSAMKLRSLVEDMVNLSLLQMGDAEIQRKPVPVQKMMLAAYDEIIPAAEAKSQCITIHMPESPQMVWADEEKITLAFANLLSNAVRFTSNSGRIAFCAESKPHGVCVMVEDNGIGIPEEELENIFKDFYQVEHHLTRRYSGLGLGLAISRVVVELHGGRIWAESPGVNKGSTFYILLPRYDSD